MKLKYSSLIIIFCLFIFHLSGCVGLQSSKREPEAHTMQKRVINPWSWQDKFGFVQANEVTGGKRTLYTAGIVSVDQDGNLLHPGDMEKQINQIFDNMEILVTQADFKLSDVVKFTYYTTNVQAFSEAGAVLGSRLRKAGCRPATSLIGVNSLFHPGCVVEIEATLVN